MTTEFVRWLGAFAPCESFTDSVDWELTQSKRQVAAEPLFRGHSHVLSECKKVHIGLIADMNLTQFVTGYTRDVWSVTDRQGYLFCRDQKNEKDGIRKLSRFCRIWASQTRRQHGEVWLDFFTAKAVAVRRNSYRMQEAKELAWTLGLPLVVVRVR